MMFFLCLSQQAFANPLKELYEQASISFYQGDFQRAAELFQKVVDIYPLAQAYHYLGLAHKELGTDLNKVVDMFKKAVEIDPGFTEAYENLSKACYGVGSYSEAEKYGLKAVELNPHNVSSQLSMGWIYLLGKGNAGEAIPYFEKAMAMQPTAFGYLGLGMAYIVDDQHHKTLEMITVLRQMEELDLALQLEKMMHERQLVPIHTPIGPMIVPERQAGILVKNIPSAGLEPYPSLKEGENNMAVRLRKILKKDFERRNFDRKDGPSAVQTGADRIKELQSRGANTDYQLKGSGY